MYYCHCYLPHTNDAQVRAMTEKLSTPLAINEQMLIDGKEQRAYSHVYLMEHVTYTKIDELIQDLREPGAFPEQNTFELASKMHEHIMKWLLATRMKSHRAKKDDESGIVIPEH